MYVVFYPIWHAQALQLCVLLLWLHFSWIRKNGDNYFCHNPLNSFTASKPGRMSSKSRRRTRWVASLPVFTVCADRWWWEEHLTLTPVLQWSNIPVTETNFFKKKQNWFPNKKLWKEIMSSPGLLRLLLIFFVSLLCIYA